EVAQARRATLDVESEGIGDQITDVLEVIGGRRQRHSRLGGNRTVPDGAHTIADDDPHGGVEDRLAANLTTSANGLAPVVLDTFRDSTGEARGTGVGGHNSHERQSSDSPKECVFDTSSCGKF